MTAHRPPPPDATVGGSLPSAPVRGRPDTVELDTHGRSGGRTALAFGLLVVALAAVGVAVVASAVAGIGLGGVMAGYT